MSSFIYNKFKEHVGKGDVNLNTGGDVIKVMLVSSSYTPDQDTHEFRNQVTNEITGTGYTAAGATLTATGVTRYSLDTSTDKALFKADPTTWGSSTITARAAVLYVSKGSSASDILMAYIDFGSDKSSSNGNFTINWAAGGVLTLA